jgi:hypothetical protein
MILQIATNPTAELAHSFIDITTGCFIIISVMSGVIVFLYKKHEDLYKRLEAKNDLFINELRRSNEQLTNVCNSYNQFVTQVDKMMDLLLESKK